MARERGVGEAQLIVDPGPDFAKSPAESVETLRAIDRLAALGHPWLAAVSRKYFLAAVTGRAPAERLAGTLAAVGHAADHGAAIVRVHDVAETVDYLAVREVLAGGAEVGAFDADDDGLTNLEEHQNDTDPLDGDSDDDGLTDGDEVNVHDTDPNDDDSDDDGLTDGDEVNAHGTDPNDADCDDDGMSDGCELNHGLDPWDDSDADDDPDGDGLTNREECELGTDPHNGDTDGDDLPDGVDPNPTVHDYRIYMPQVFR